MGRLKKLKTGEIKKRGGSRPNSGRKPSIAKLKKEAYKIAEAEFWADLAENKAIKRLIQILDKNKTTNPVLMKAIQEVLNRALGKPPETIDLSNKGKAFKGPLVYLPARHAEKD
jgi:hypothetical protein